MTVPVPDPAEIRAIVRYGIDDVNDLAEMARAAWSAEHAGFGEAVDAELDRLITPPSGADPC